jgi:hypothetical protein
LIQKFLPGAALNKKKPPPEGAGWSDEAAAPQRTEEKTYNFP